MCKQCGHINGSTRHLLYWQWEWAKRFMLTWYHIVNRRAYHKWKQAQDKKKVSRRIQWANFYAIDID